MIRMLSNAVGTVFGNANCWCLEPPADAVLPSSQRPIQLEIVGEEQQGYYLVISPKGFFTADAAYATLQQAKAAAKGLFGLDEQDWQLVSSIR